ERSLDINPIKILKSMTQFMAINLRNMNYPLNNNLQQPGIREGKGMIYQARGGLRSKKFKKKDKRKKKKE
ncbi:MAG: hypothetical protein AB7W47_17120, partial [Calditrichaceae bacterium]